MNGFKMLPAVSTGPARVGSRTSVAKQLFCVEHGRMVLLHGFIKKTQKTPARAIEVAVSRMPGGA